MVYLVSANFSYFISRTGWRGWVGLGWARREAKPLLPYSSETAWNILTKFYRMDDARLKMVYVNFHKPTFPRDFSITITLSWVDWAGDAVPADPPWGWWTMTSCSISWSTLSTDGALGLGLLFWFLGPVISLQHLWLAQRASHNSTRLISRPKSELVCIEKRI